MTNMACFAKVKIRKSQFLMLGKVKMVPELRGCHEDAAKSFKTTIKHDVAL